MNLYDIKTKEDLKDYADKKLVVYSDPLDEQGNPIQGEFTIPRNPLRPNSHRAAALLDVEISLRRDEVKLVVGVYDLDSNGDPIYANSIKPYETDIVATDFGFVDPTTGLVVEEADMDQELKEQGFYIPEFTFYLLYTKTNKMYVLDNQTNTYLETVGVNLWQLFKRNISVSKKMLEP